MDSFGHDGASSTFAPFMTTSSAVANNGMSTISSMDFFTPSAVDPSTKTAVDYDNEFLTFLKSVGITPDSVGLTAAEIESEETNSDGFLTASPPSNSVQRGDGIRPASYHDEVISAKSASSTYPAAWGLGKVPVNHASSETEQEDEPARPRVLAASASETYDPWHDIFQDGNFEPSQYLTPDLVAQLHEHNQEKPLDERKKSDRTNSLEYETEYYYEYDAGSPQSGQETKNAPPAAIAAAEEEEEQEYEYYYYDEEERKEEEEEKKEEQAVQKPRQQSPGIISRPNQPPPSQRHNAGPPAAHYRHPGPPPFVKHKRQRQRHRQRGQSLLQRFIGDRRQDDGSDRPYDYVDPFDKRFEQQYLGLDYNSASGPGATGEGDLVGSSQTGQPTAAAQQTPSLTRRVADMVFNPTSFTLISLIGIPIILAAGYWLFVVNGPTPVVRAREGEVRGQGTQEEEDGMVKVLEATLLAILGLAEEKMHIL